MSGWPNASSLIVADTLNLTCTAAGGAPTSFEWYLGTTKLNSTGTMGEIYEKAVALSDDAGAYRCLAKNADGEAESSIKYLVVQGKPKQSNIC
jgi:hypothetical protein